MKSKEKNKKVKITLKTIIFSAVAFFIFLYMFMFYNIYFPTNKSYAKETDTKPEETKISNANKINIDEIINTNTGNGQAIQITQKEEVLELIKQEANYVNIKTYKDLSGNDRVITCKKI